MIYRAICDQLPRSGILWNRQDRAGPAASHDVLKEASQLDYFCDPKSRTELVGKLDIMRTCRQVHSELAGTLYSEPFEIRTGMFEVFDHLVFPATYASLVRNVFVRIELGGEENPERWIYTSHVANSVAGVFPSLRTLRVGWSYHIAITGEDRCIPETPKVPFVTEERGHWDDRVKKVEKTLRKQCRTCGVKPSVPHQFELVHLNSSGGPDFQKTPVSEAALKLRRKPPKAK
jgi:hypothetical protein